MGKLRIALGIVIGLLIGWPIAYAQQVYPPNGVTNTGGNAFTGINSFLDGANFSVLGSADPTKKFQVLMSGDSTATISTLAFTDTASQTHTVPNATGTLLQTGLNNPGFTVAGTETFTSGNGITFNGTLNGLSWSANGPTLQTTASSLKAGATDNLIVVPATSPTITANCGTSPSVLAGSSDTAGAINVGTGGTATTCTITFHTAYTTNAPFCVVSDDSSIVSVKPTSSTTTLIVTATAAFGASDIISWNCIGGT